jgi:hypothetical protein
MHESEQRVGRKLQTCVKQTLIIEREKAIQKLQRRLDGQLGSVQESRMVLLFINCCWERLFNIAIASILLNTNRNLLLTEGRKKTSNFCKTDFNN